MTDGISAGRSSEPVEPDSLERARLVVTSYWHALEHTSYLDPHKIVSIMDPGSCFELRLGPSARDHLKLFFHDVTYLPDDPNGVPTQIVVPNQQHVNEILAFGRGWNPDERMMVHCGAGVSRSAACALLLLNQRFPNDPIGVVDWVRTSFPWTEPNPVMLGFTSGLPNGGQFRSTCKGLPVPRW